MGLEGYLPGDGLKAEAVAKFAKKIARHIRLKPEDLYQEPADIWMDHIGKEVYTSTEMAESYLGGVHNWRDLGVHFIELCRATGDQDALDDLLMRSLTDAEDYHQKSK